MEIILLIMSLFQIGQFTWSTSSYYLSNGGSDYFYPFWSPYLCSSLNTLTLYSSRTTASITYYSYNYPIIINFDVLYPASTAGSWTFSTQGYSYSYTTSYNTASPTEQILNNICGSAYFTTKTFYFYFTSNTITGFEFSISNSSSTIYIRNFNIALFTTDTTWTACTAGYYYYSNSIVTGSTCNKQCYYNMPKPYNYTCISFSVTIPVNSGWVTQFDPNLNSLINQNLYSSYFGGYEGTSTTFSTTTSQQVIFYFAVQINSNKFDDNTGINFYVNQIYLGSIYYTTSSFVLNNLYYISSSSIGSSSSTFYLTSKLIIPQGNIKISLKGNFTNTLWKLSDYGLKNVQCDQYCTVCSKNFWCDQCASGYLISYNGICTSQTVRSYVNSTHSIAYERVTKYSRFLVKQFIDFSIDDQTMNILPLYSNPGGSFLKGGGVYNSYEGYSKRVFGGWGVWAQGAFYRSYTLSANHGFTIYFTVIFGSSFPTSSYFQYSVNGGSYVTIYTTSNKTVEYRATAPYSSLNLYVQCVGTSNNVENAYCAISDYMIVVLYCNPNCASCTDADVCNVAKPTCSTTQYYDGFSRTCISCPSECLTCYDYENCLTCKTLYQLIGNRCILSCTSNQYFDGTNCQQCSSICVTCSSPSYCLTCNSLLFRYQTNGQCLCYNGYYEDSVLLTCKLCHFLCTTCTGPSNQECNSCKTLSNLSLQSNTCSCLDGYYFDEFYKICNQCNQKCLTCFYQTKKSCLSCDIALNRILQGIQCKCQFGYYEMDNSLICEQCPTIEDINLQQCYHSCDEWITQQWFNINCNTCLTNYQLINSQYCEPICGDSLIVGYEQCDDTSQYCLNCQMKCPQNQLDCNIQSTFNDVCGDGYITSEEECDDGNTINYDGCSNCKLDCQAECTLCIRGICYECYIIGWQLDLKVQTCTEISGDTYYVGNEKCSSVHSTSCNQYRIISPSAFTSCIGSSAYIASCGSNQCVTCNKGYQIYSCYTYCTPICGDGIVVPGEECDDGNLTDYDGCSSLCLWQCQPLNFCKTCRYNKCIQCQYGYTLNSITNKCDIINLCNDNNSLMNDGCYNNFIQCQTSCKSCTLNGCVLCNKGYKLNLSNNQCDPICGDKIIVKEEDCDDGNIIPYDGCYYCQFSCPPECLYCAKGQCLSNDIDEESKNIINMYKIIRRVELSVFQFPILPTQFFYTDFKLHCSLVFDNNCLQCEEGFSFDQTSGSCKTICGDGIQTEYEECDDGNDLQDDGCNTCQYKCNDACLYCDQGDCVYCQNGYYLPQNKTEIQQCILVSDCSFYPGLYLNALTNICEPICGDGIISMNEDCDNGQDGLTYMCDDCQYCNTTECQQAIEFDCGEGYYFSKITRVCDSKCGDGIAVGDEECDDGNTINTDFCSNSCLNQCDPNCAQCVYSSDTLSCLTCITDYELVDGTTCELIVIDNVLNGITCSDGFYVSQLGTCITICGDGIVAGDEQCDDGNLINNDGCDSTCIPSQNSVCQGSICASIEYPIASLTLIKEDKGLQQIKLSIDQQMKFSQSSYTVLQFINTLEIYLSNGKDNQYDLSVSSDNQITSELSNVSLTINIKYYDYISGPQLNVYFQQQDYLQNQYSYYIQTSLITQELKDPNVLSSSQQSIAAYLVLISTYAVNVMIAIIITSFLTGRSEISYNLIDLLQLLYFFKYLNTDIGQNLELIYQSFEKVQIQSIVNVNFVNYYTQEYFNFDFLYFDTPTIFNQDQRSANFLVSSQPIMSALLISVITTLIFKIITSFIIRINVIFRLWRQNKFFYHFLYQFVKFTKGVRVTTCKIQIKDILPSLLYELGICSFLSISYSPFTTWQGMVSGFTGFIFLMGTIIFIQYQVIYIEKYQHIKVLQNFKQSRESYVYLYTCFSKILFTLILTMLGSQNICQVIMCFFNEAQQTLIVFLLRPYESTIENIKQIVTHLMLSFSCIMQLGNIMYSSDIEKLMFIGWIIIGQYATIILTNIVIDISQFVNIYLKARKAALALQSQPQFTASDLFF